MADKISPEARSKNMSAIRSKNTRIEDRVAKELWKRGIRFWRNPADLIGKPDIAVKKYKTAIFIDSCFWHACSLHGHIPKSNTDYWTKKLERNQKRDAEVTSYYRNAGWNILRIWEHDIEADFSGTIERITEFIQLARQPLDSKTSKGG